MFDFRNCEPHKDYTKNVIMGNDKISLSGTAKLILFDKKNKYLVARNDFPGDFDGILGINVMKTHKAVNDVGKNILTLSGKEIPINEKPIEVAPYESKIYEINLSNKGKHLLVTGKNITPEIVESKPTLTLATCNGTSDYIHIFKSQIEISEIKLPEDKEIPKINHISSGNHEYERKDLLMENTRISHIPKNEAKKVMNIL